MKSIAHFYTELLELVKDKDYFVLTTNVCHQFQLAGFDKTHLFYTQGDYGLWQCSKACHDNEEEVRSIVREQEDMRKGGVHNVHLEDSKIR